jgi:maleylacetate reductase
VTRSFEYDALPMRVVLAPGALARVPDEVERAGIERVLVVSGPGHRDLAEDVARSLGGRAVGVLSDARMHVPSDVADVGRAQADRTRADGCVAVGGGSAIGLGKAIALGRDVRLLAVPTTYAGSEMTPVWGITEDGVKRTGRDRRVLPVAVVYDPDLTVSLPPDLTVTSALNAVAHAVEGLYAPDASPVVSLMAEEGTRAIVGALPALVADGADLDARTEAQYGAWLCGAVLGATTMGLHHKLCHVLGGSLGLPHAPTHTVVLPHVLAFNAPAAPGMAAAIGRALDTADPTTSLWTLAGDLGAPRSLRDLGMAEDDIERVADLATESPYANPRAVTRDDVVALVRAAWAGDRPAAATAPPR